MASLEGLGLLSPSWLVSAKSGACRAFRVPQRHRGRMEERLRPLPGPLPVECCGSLMPLWTSPRRADGCRSPASRDSAVVGQPTRCRAAGGPVRPQRAGLQRRRTLLHEVRQSGALVSNADGVRRRALQLCDQVTDFGLAAAANLAHAGEAAGGEDQDRVRLGLVHRYHVAAQLYFASDAQDARRNRARGRAQCTDSAPGGRGRALDPSSGISPAVRTVHNLAQALGAPCCLSPALARATFAPGSISRASASRQCRAPGRSSGRAPPPRTDGAG